MRLPLEVDKLKCDILSSPSERSVWLLQQLELKPRSWGGSCLVATMAARSSDISERALRGFPLGKNTWLFGGTTRAGRLHGDTDHHRKTQYRRSAGLTCRRPPPIGGTPIAQVEGLLPSNWRPVGAFTASAAQTGRVPVLPAPKAPQLRQNRGFCLADQVSN